MTRFFKGLIIFFASILLVLIVIFSVAYWNRDVILERITAQLNEGIDGEFKIESLDFTLISDFPNFSLSLNNVSLRGSHYATYGKDFFVAEHVFVDINLYQLLKKNINVRSLKLENANLFIFKAKDGYTNLNIFKKDTISSTVDSTAQSENPFLLSLRNIEFKNVQATYSDSIKNKSHSVRFIDTKHVVESNDSVYNTHIKGKIHFDSLVFKQNSGGFLANKETRADLHVNINKLSKILTIEPSSLEVNDNKINLSGYFHLQPGKTFELVFSADKIDLEEGRVLLDKQLQKTVGRFKVDKPVDVVVNLKGKSVPNDRPAVDVQLGSSNAHVEFGKLKMNKFYFTGSFSNHFDSTKVFDNKNSKVTISSFDGVMNSFPVKGNVTISQLQDPYLKLDVLTDMKLKDLNGHIDSSRFHFGKGTVSTRIKYEGRLAEYTDNTLTKYEGRLNGITVVRGGSFFYKPRRMKLEKLEAVFEFDKSKFKIENIAFDLNGSPLKMKGTIENFVPFFIQPKNKGYIKMDVTSSRFDLTMLSDKRPGHKTTKQIQRDQKKVSDLMDKVLEKLEFDLNVKVNELIMNQFRATDFSGRLALSHQSLEARPVTMNVAGGTMSLNFKLSDLSKTVNPMAVTAKVNNARIKEFFEAFDNFNQKTITGDNLSGLISADVKFNARLNDNLKIEAPSIWGDLEVKIKNGRLKNFEPMENMSNFLFKKRDFSDVEFAEIDSHFFLAGPDLDINRMEIQSTVLSLFLHGRYSFTDSTSLSVQLPLSNLKKRDKNYVPKNVGVDAKVGPSIFLHVYKDEQGKIAIAYDPFKKYAKVN